MEYEARSLRAIRFLKPPIGALLPWRAFPPPERAPRVGPAPRCCSMSSEVKGEGHALEHAQHSTRRQKYPNARRSACATQFEG